MGEMKVTTLNDLKEYGKGSVVELPPFSDTQPFVARIIRPSLIRIAKSGTIPNKLIDAAMELFYPDEEGQKQKDNKSKLEDMEKSEEILQIIAKESLVSPTYDEITESGLELTYPQLVAIYNFTQTGVNELYSFRADKQD